MVYMCDQQCSRETELRCHSSSWTFCIPQSDLGNVIDQSVSTSFHWALYSSCSWNVPSLNHRGSEKTADIVMMMKGRTRFARGNRMVSHSQSRLQSVTNLPAQHWRGHFLAMHLGLLCNTFRLCKLPTFTLFFSPLISHVQQSKKLKFVLFRKQFLTE